MKKLSRLLFLESIKESLGKSDLIARQRFHLFKLATLYTLIVYTSFLWQISAIDDINIRVLLLVTALFILVSVNYLFFSVHKRQELASISLLGLLYTMLHIVAYKSGGLRNATMMYIPALILLAYMLTGKKGGMVMAAMALFHLSLFYYINRNTAWVNYDLLGNDPKIIDFDFFVTAVLGIFMVTIQAGYIEKSKNEIIEDIKDKNHVVTEVTERLQLATRAAKIGIWDYDILNNRVVWDEEMFRIFALRNEDFESTYEHWQSLLHPEDRELRHQEILAAIRGDREFNTVYRIVWPDGSIHHIQANGLVQRDENGKAIRMIGANWDISQRINHELKILELNESLEKKIRERTKELVEKKMLLDEAQHMARIGNWNIDLLTKAVIWSDGTRDIFGVDNEFPASYDAFVSFIHPDDRSSVAEKLKDSSLNRETIEDEFRIIRPNGSIHIIHSQTRCIFNKEGETIRIYGILQDITERKVAEETLRRSEANLHTIFDNTKTCYILLDTDLKVLSFNPMAEQWARNALKSELKEGDSYLDYYPEERHSALLAKAGKVLGADIDQYEISYVYDDNSIHHYEVLLSPVLIKGNVYGICIALSDITQKKQSEKETQEYVEELQLKNKNLRQFAFMVSHNLRAPIAKIQGLAYLFEDDGENEHNKTLVQFINNEVDNLDHVINDMNAIITTGDAENTISEEVNFNNEFKLIVKVLENQIRESNAYIVSDFSEVGKITSVKSYVYSMMYNLMSNAIKYREPQRPLEIEVRTFRENDLVCLHVKDNGIGINLEKHKEKIFDLYARVHASSIPGKGMGLSMVKVQAETLGGKVELESELNKGSTFRIFLPST
jgi:PAS domain S-box-containing protein